jgi:hypothetical protein
MQARLARITKQGATYIVNFGCHISIIMQARLARITNKVQHLLLILVNILALHANVYKQCALI